MNNNENLIRRLIRDSIQRAVQESVAGLLVVGFFGAIHFFSDVGSPRYFGCLLILMGTAFIAGVVWSFALSTRLLRTHAPSDIAFWREAFQAQARLLRLVPLWYCAPLFLGVLLFVAPVVPWEILPFSLVVGLFVLVVGAIIRLNRRAAAELERQALELV